MALLRPRVVFGVVGGLITAMTLQGCLEEGVDSMIGKACEVRSGEAFDALKKGLKEDAYARCEELLGNDTTIKGRDCETEVLDRFSTEEGGEKENFTAECVQCLTEKYEALASGNLTMSISEMHAFFKDLTSDFFHTHEQQLKDLKDNLIDEVTGALEKLQEDDEANSTVAAADEANSTAAAANSTRLYLVADAHKSVGVPGLAIGASFAMIATGTLAVAVAAASCSRRRGFHVVGGSEQAAGGSAQHA